jgi:hypothetical protein
MNAMRTCLALLILSQLAASGQPPAGEPPRRDGDRERRGPGGPPGMGSGGPMRPPMGFEKLSEEEKQTMREAFSKAWSDPAVVAARDEALKANEQVRRVLNETMKRHDPKVAAILDKMKPDYPVDDRGLPLLPSPESPDFAKMALARLGAEALAVARPGRHEETRRFHERIIQHPRMKESAAALEKAAPGERIESFRKVRELYRQLVGEEFARLAKAREQREAAGDEKKPTPPAPKP